MDGIFITFEGGEGAGKSTQIARLEGALRSERRSVLKTREPGGSPGAEEIRNLMVSGAANRWDAMTELLLATAARRDHAQKTILPALARGEIVLCDRYVHSTLAYQVGRDGVSDALVHALHRDAIEDLWPSLTFVLDLDPKVAMKRTLARDGRAQGRFEKMDQAFHLQLRDRFVQIAETDDRCILIDAATSTEDIEQEIWRHTKRHLSRKLHDE